MTAQRYDVLRGCLGLESDLVLVVVGEQNEAAFEAVNPDGYGNPRAEIKVLKGRAEFEVDRYQCCLGQHQQNQQGNICLHVA